MQNLGGMAGDLHVGVHNQSRGSNARLPLAATAGVWPNLPIRAPRALPIHRGSATPASDLYSLGATLLYVVSGQPPFAFPQERMRINYQDRVTTGPVLAGEHHQLTRGQ